MLLTAVLGMAVMMGGCSGKTSAEKDTEPAPPRTEASTMKNEEASNADEETTPVEIVYEATEEIINASKFDRVIQVGNTVLNMPATCQDFVTTAGKGNFTYQIPYIAAQEMKHTTATTIDGTDYVMEFSNPTVLLDNSQYDLTATDEALLNAFKGSYYTADTNTYESTHIIRNDEAIGIACGFYTSQYNGNYYCKYVVFDRTLNLAVVFDAAYIKPLNGETLIDAGKEYFIELMKELAETAYFTAPN